MRADVSRGLVKGLFFAVATILLSGILISGSGRGVGAQEESADPVEKPSFEVPEKVQFAPGEIVVKRALNTPKAEIEALNRSNDARIEEELPGTRISVVDLPPGLSVEQAAERYESSPAVEHAEPNFRYFPAETPNDPLYPEMWNLENTGQTGGKPDADVDANLGWEVTTGSPDPIVAVIDTGVQRQHPDLADNIWTNPGEIPGNNIDDDGNGYVDDVNGWDFYNDDNTVYDDPIVDDHGTHVAGTVAAEGNNGIGVTGVNWQARIMVLKFIGSNGGFLSDAVRSLDYALDEGAKISNNSWGCTGSKNDPEPSCWSDILRDKIGEADRRGHLFVAAAGNNGNDNDPSPKFFPASYANSNIISVAATNAKDQLAGFSNYGDATVDLGAPGVGILSTLPPDTYGKFSGTSMASPHVAGTAALLKTKDSSLGDEEIKRQILRSVEKRQSLRGKTVTGGRLNTAAALGVGPTQLSLNATPRTTVFRDATTLSGKLTSLSGRPLSARTVVITGRPAGSGSFRKYGEATTDSNGNYALRGVEPFKRTFFRARFNGNQNDGLEADTSPGQKVNVKVRVTLKTDGSQLKLGKRRGMSGRVFPDHPQGEVRIIIKRNGSIFDRARVDLNNQSGYRFVYRPPRTGNYAFYAVFPKDGDHLANRSPQKGFRVVE